MYFISKFCLLCLKEDDGNLHNVENKDSNDVSIEEKLDYCVFELISSGHEFPGYICKECLDIVDLFYNFKQKCFKNNRKIRNFMDSLKQLPFGKITFRDLSVPVEDIKNKMPRRSSTIKKTENKMKNLKPEPKEDLENLKPELFRSTNVRKTMEYKMKDLKPETKPDTSKLNKSTGMFQCEECPKQFFHEKQLKSHSTTHRILECSICQKVFTTLEKLKNHERYHRFRDKLKLNTEIPKIEPKIEGYECGICFKKITYKHSLKRHFLKFHVKKEDIEEGNINLSYNVIQNPESNLSLDNLIDLTDDESDFATVCDSLKTEMSKINEKTEENSKSSKLNKSTGMFQCEKCSKQFFHNSQLKRHLKTHRKSEGKYECQVCQRRFPFAMCLKSHERSHKTTLKPKNFGGTPIFEQNSDDPKPSGYECGICYKKIVHKYNLKRHFERFHVKNENVEANINLSYNIIQDTKPNLGFKIESIGYQNEALSDVEVISNENEIIDISDSDAEKIVKKRKIEHCNKDILESIEKIKNPFGGSAIKFGEQNGNEFQCFVCDKQFTRQCKLSTHINTHFEENAPYKF